jgi:NADH dehydrogenase [ubiquinone] 1 alpha subcomplex assembly factor 6
MATSPGYGERWCVLRGLINRETSAGESCSPGRGRLSPVAALVHRYDHDRFQTVLFAPPELREPLFALYAFNYEISRVRETVSQPMLGQIRLQWWRECIAAAFDGGPVRHHIVAEALTTAIRALSLTRAHFDRLIDARETDLDEVPAANLAALEDYAEGTSARLVYLALESLGVREPGAEKAGFHIGVAYALAGLLRAMPFHARAGRLIIPANIAERTALYPADYRALRSTRALRSATAEIAAAAARHLVSARGHGRSITRRALPAFLPAIVAARSLTRLKRVGYDPFDPTLAVPDPTQSWRLAISSLRNRI